MRRYWIETYGCQMNKAESGALEHDLRERGWQAAARSAEADVVVLNTCSVRRTAENRIWGRLGFYNAEKGRRSFRLVLMGCMGERLKEQILVEAPQVDLVVGNFQKHRLAELLEGEGGGDGEGEGEGRRGAVPPRRPGAEAVRPGQRLLADPGEYHFPQWHSSGGFRVYVPIMHGCNNYCSYCVVPYVRGPEVSRKPESILEEVRRLQDSSACLTPVRDITLLGQNVNSYRYVEPDGTALTFTGLLRRLIPVLREKNRLRFLTSHPKDLSEELMELMAGPGPLCRHLHLPVQHGSDRILEAMGRGYTRAHYLGLVEGVRKSVPEVSLTTDILVGFPGETEEDYRQTLELMREVQFDEAFTYRYNPREGTRAFRLEDDVPEAVKQNRLSGVIELQRRITAELKRRRVGGEVEVLVEGVSRRSGRELLGRTEGDEMVVFPGAPERIGGFARVRLTALSGTTYRGEELEE
jgi:tRNA-2-methylthio-N6-dimethylallyladenosine synthase